MLLKIGQSHTTGKWLGNIKIYFYLISGPILTIYNVSSALYN